MFKPEVEAVIDFGCTHVRTTYTPLNVVEGGKKGRGRSLRMRSAHIITDTYISESNTLPRDYIKALL
jgi:hypothetical protein